MDEFMLSRLISMILKLIGTIFIIYAYIHLKVKNKQVTRKVFFAFFIGFLFYIIPVDFIWSKDYEQILAVLQIPQIWIMLLIVAYWTILKLFVKSRNKYFEIDANDDIDIFKRTIDFKCNPAIIGFLFSHRLDLKDLSGDILNLYAKRIIDIRKDEYGKNKFYIGEKYEENKESLTDSDKYIIDYINKGSKKFDFNIWKDYVKVEYNKCKFSKKRDGQEKILITIIMLVLIIGFIILKFVFNDEIIFISLKLGGIILLITLGYSVVYNDLTKKYLNLTEEGKVTLKDGIKLKKFMEEYTLLKDRTVEEICLYESYIPYAVALGVNKKYKGTMFEIFDEDISNIIEDIDSIESYDQI